MGMIILRNPLKMELLKRHLEMILQLWDLMGPCFGYCAIQTSYEIFHEMKRQFIIQVIRFNHLLV
jgi:hypothetical protein